MNKPIKQNILKVFGRDPRSMDELVQCVIAVIESQQNRDYWYNEPGPRSKKPRREFPNHRVLGFAWDLKRGDVSCTHSAPEGCPTNFMCKPHLPTHYPGWSGRVWIRYGEYPDSWGHSPFEKTLTHTGTGGAGSYDGPWEAVCSEHYQRYGYSRSKNQYPAPQCYSWDYRIYDADWPALVEQLEKEQVWNRLANRPDQNLQHKFSWTDPDTLLADAEFMAECATLRAQKVTA